MHISTPQLRRALPLILAVSSLAAWPLQAAQFCVSTGTQLANALNSAATNDQDDAIRIVKTTLTGTSNPAGNPRWSYRPGSNDLDNNLTLTGGWSSGDNCASQISTDPTSTALDAQYNGQALQFSTTAADQLLGDVVVGNFTITRGFTSVSSAASGFDWGVNGASSSSLLAENVLVVAGNATGIATSSVRVSHAGSGHAKLRNFIVYGNIAQGSGGVAIIANGSAYAVLSNTTIFDNQSAASASGLLALGIVTLANNAVADNTSSAGTSFQMRSDAATQLTLRNNHFGTKSLVGGAFSEIGTTTGDAQWTQTGSVMVPNTISPLRDSGVNNPTGGLASTDFQGDARIVNVTVDRGAVEAAAIPHIGPTISAIAPTPGTGEFMPDGLVDTTVTRSITFASTGGTGAGTTSLNCVDNNVAATLSASANQTIAVGAAVTPVVVTMTYAPVGYNLGVTCTANTNGNVCSFQYAFFMPNASPARSAGAGRSATSGQHHPTRRFKRRPDGVAIAHVHCRRWCSERRSELDLRAVVRRDCGHRQCQSDGRLWWHRIAGGSFDAGDRAGAVCQRSLCCHSRRFVAVEPGLFLHHEFARRDLRQRVRLLKIRRRR
ncbi:MAG: hypothetical protein IPH50_06215 [Rhodanobacteraceae bacterium]|nr:hypothetical protein [Rhodanobacteraceae bacterium]